MANAGDFAYTLKQQADIVRVVGDYVKLRKAGAQNFSGLCPIHSENTPSFAAHATRQFFHCFGCGPDSGFLLRGRLKGEFEEAVLRESGFFPWKEESSQPSAVSRQENSKSLDSPRHSANEAAELARDDNGGVEQQIPPFGRNDKGGSAEESTAINMYSKFRNRVMFPIASEAGKVIAFTGRTLSTDEKA